MDSIVAEKTEAPTRRPIPEVGAKAFILFNEKAGSVSAGDGEKLVEAVRQAGIQDFVMIGPEKLSRKLLERARKFDVLIVLGGDGTARMVAELAPRDGPPLVLLPGGTLNILSKALYGELAWPEALAAALERGVVKRLTSGRANGEPFYVAALFGPSTLLARAREAMREGKPISAWRRFMDAWKRSFTRSIRARVGREPMQKAEAIGVLCPAFSGGIEADHLEWVKLDARRLLDFARVSLRALTADWRNDSSVQIAPCRTSDIVSLGMIPATLDGEPRTFMSRVRVTYDAQGPRVIALEDNA
jgi:diacylglycerol kinase family enzyme